MTRYAVLTLLCLGTVVAYVQRSAIAVPARTIEGELGLGPDDMGLVMAVWFWVYAAFQIPAGWVADRLGSKPALILFAVTWSVLTGTVGLATGFVGLLVLWGLMGAAQAGIFPCATKAIGATFPPTGQAFASGMLACSMALGGALSPWLTGRLLGSLTWQDVFALYAVPGLAWAALLGLTGPRPDAPAATVRRPIQWSRLVTDGQMRLLCGQQFLRASAIAFFYTWFPRFLQESKGLSQGESGDLAMWPPLAGMCGGLIGGLISDWLLRRTGNSRLSRQGLACTAMVVCAAVSLAAYYTADAAAVTLLLSIAAFCGLMGGVSGYTIAIQFGGGRVATVFAAMNMCGNVGAGLFPYAVGRRVAATGNWDFALLLFTGLFAADAILWALLNPKRPLFEDDE
jgi:MFS family permease